MEVCTATCEQRRVGKMVRKQEWSSFAMMRPRDVHLEESMFVIVFPFLDSAEPSVSVQIRAQWGRLC